MISGAVLVDMIDSVNCLLIAGLISRLIIFFSCLLFWLYWLTRLIVSTCMIVSTRVVLLVLYRPISFTVRNLGPSSISVIATLVLCIGNIPRSIVLSMLMLGYMPGAS